MKSILITALAAVLALHTHAQISYEKGYYVDLSDKKVECLIKNMDWDNNPVDFQYKMSETSEPALATIDNVKEFGIGTAVIYKSFYLDIDRSSEKIDEITTNRNPVFKKERLFLRVLVVGNANLYSYKAGEIWRYFYGKSDSTLHQLISKKFRGPNGAIFTNESYKQQLLNDLTCAEISGDDIQKLEYSRTSLVKFFSKYNECSGGGSTLVEERKRDRILIALRPGLNYSTFEVKESEFYGGGMKFEPQAGLRLGLLFEFLFPFNNNKWAITIEPTYQYFKSSGATPSYTATVDYNSIEFPIGLRYYMFLKGESKLFVTVSGIMDYSFDSSLTYNNGQSWDVSSKPTAALGAGYDHKRFSIEVRYLLGRDILNKWAFIPSSYKTASLVLGYRLNRPK
jgi:hypothetical protein